MGVITDVGHTDRLFIRTWIEIRASAAIAPPHRPFARSSEKHLVLESHVQNRTISRAAKGAAAETLKPVHRPAILGR